jgi:hypothetical protein
MAAQGQRLTAAISTLLNKFRLARGELSRTARLFCVNLSLCCTASVGLTKKGNAIPLNSGVHQFFEPP